VNRIPVRRKVIECASLELKLGQGRCVDVVDVAAFLSRKPVTDLVSWVQIPPPALYCYDLSADAM